MDAVTRSLWCKALLGAFRLNINVQSGVASKRHCERYVVKDSAGATRAFAVGKGVIRPYRIG